MTFPSLGDALAWLDGHQNLERMLATSPERRKAPDLERMRLLMDALGNPEATSPVVHVTGTNGKTSTARCIATIFASVGLRVGMFTSPHLESISERISVDGQPIDDESLIEVLSTLAGVEGLLAPPEGFTWFELVTAAGFIYFSDRPVDVMVLEVGMGGRWDATNVADASVAVVTNVGLDHLEFLGPTRQHVAREKAGVVKAGSTLVLGETEPTLTAIFEAQGPEAIWLAGREWDCEGNDAGEEGRILDLRTPYATYEQVHLGLHGSHQGRNFAAALSAVEAFFGRPIGDKLVRAAAATVSSPGRMEVVASNPLVVLDGAKNLEGATAAGRALLEEFTAQSSIIMVVGMLVGKDPREMLSALGAQRARLVIACPAPSPRAQPAEEIAQAARSLGCTALTADGVAEAIEEASNAAGPDDLIFVTGSLYVVGSARAILAARRQA